MDINPQLIKETLEYRSTRLQEGEKILYEGKEAMIISINPLLIIKVEDRVICGDLHNRIKLLEK